MLPCSISSRLFVCVIYANYELGSEIAISKGDEFLKASLDHCYIPVDAFHPGMFLYGMARQADKAKHKRQAKKQGTH